MSGWHILCKKQQYVHVIKLRDEINLQLYMFTLSTDDSRIDFWYIHVVEGEIQNQNIYHVHVYFVIQQLWYTSNSFNSW